MSEYKFNSISNVIFVDKGVDKIEHYKLKYFRSYWLCYCTALAGNIFSLFCFEDGYDPRNLGKSHNVSN